MVPPSVERGLFLPGQGSSVIGRIRDGFVHGVASAIDVANLPDDESLAMGPVLSPSDDIRRQLGQLYAPVQDELPRVEEILRRELRSRDPCVDEMVKHGFRLGGKRLRPALVLLAAKATGEITQDHLILGAVVEMIHTATLVHDDVLDEAEIRRHLETANARWDNEASVLLGDFLFTHAFFLASGTGSTFACRTLGRATNIMCEGEMRQVANRGRYEMTESEYLSIIEAKTAELCACCCRLGAHREDTENELEESLDRFGRNIGIAFQITDDLLDLCGDENLTGKSLGTDLEKQKPTLPIIRLLESTNQPRREELLALLNRPHADVHAELLEELRQSEALDYALAKAESYAEQARRELDRVPKSPARDTLEQMTHFVVNRPT